MSLYCSVGSTETDLSEQQLKELLAESLAKLGKRTNVLAVPPDAAGPDCAHVREYAARAVPHAQLADGC